MRFMVATLALVAASFPYTSAQQPNPMAGKKSPAGEVNPATQQGRSAYADRPASAG